MSSLNKFKSLLFSVLVLLFCCSKVHARQTGEPVPGAEVFLELEPDDEPIFPGGGTGGSADAYCTFSGAGEWTPGVNATPTGVNVYFTFPAKAWTSLSAKYGKTTPFNNTFNYNLTVKVGTLTFTKQIPIVLKGEDDLQAVSTTRFGPFRFATPNIEAQVTNVKTLSPTSKRQVPLSVKIACTSVASLPSNLKTTQ